MESGAISGTHAVPRIPLRFIRATTEHDGEFKLEIIGDRPRFYNFC